MNARRRSYLEPIPDGSGTRSEHDARVARSRPVTSGSSCRFASNCRQHALAMAAMTIKPDSIPSAPRLLAAKSPLRLHDLDIPTMNKVASHREIEGGWPRITGVAPILKTSERCFVHVPLLRIRRGSANSSGRCRKPAIDHSASRLHYPNREADAVTADA
jgi:hypothetical protein